MRFPNAAVLSAVNAAVNFTVLVWQLNVRLVIVDISHIVASDVIVHVHVHIFKVLVQVQLHENVHIVGEYDHTVNVHVYAHIAICCIVGLYPSVITHPPDDASKVTESAAHGTDAPHAHHEVDDQWVVSDESHVHVHPTQNLLAINNNCYDYASTTAATHQYFDVAEL